MVRWFQASCREHVGRPVVLLEQGADEADNGALVGKDADHIGAPLGSPLSVALAVKLQDVVPDQTEATDRGLLSKQGPHPKIFTIVETERRCRDKWRDSASHP